MDALCFPDLFEGKWKETRAVGLTLVPTSRTLSAIPLARAGRTTFTGLLNKGSTVDDAGAMSGFEFFRKAAAISLKLSRRLVSASLNASFDSSRKIKSGGEIKCPS